MNPKETIEQSIEWRYSQIPDYNNQAVRLFAGISDGIDGLLIDQFGQLIVAVLYNKDLKKYDREILDVLSSTFPEKQLLIKTREEINSNRFTYLYSDDYNKDNILTCQEDQSKYEIHTDPRHDFGLYLDTKSARSFLSGIAQNKTVLNLFAYTCAFGVAAMSGNAKSVTNIDPNKDYLAWGGRNAELNGTIFKRYPDTTREYLARHIRRLESGKDSPYDIVVVDPPAFLVGRGSNRVARNLWPTWMTQLKDANISEYIFVINDKSIGLQKDMNSFFVDSFGSDIKIEMVEQSFDVIGQRLSAKSDPFYFNPMVYYIRR